MLKGKEDARPTPNADAKPRKKLSFREPEIVGHMKQEIRKRLAGATLNNNQPQQHQQQPPLVVERNNNRVFGRATFHPMGEIGEDPELEVLAFALLKLTMSLPFVEEDIFMFEYFTGRTCFVKI